MALAYALRLLERDNVKLTNYGSFLECFRRSTKWRLSRTHRGVVHTAWNAGDRTADATEASRCNQLWRAPLRQALDELRDAIAPLTEEEGSKVFRDVWAARDAYIEVVLDRSDEEATERFFLKHAIRV